MIGCEPTARLEVPNVAVVTPLMIVNIPWPMLAPPSKKDTVPVGVPAPPGATVAVNVTGWPASDGFVEETTEEMPGPDM